MLVLNKAFDIGGVNCIALCDVDSEHLKNSADKVEEARGVRPKMFKDYRDLLIHYNAPIHDTEPQDPPASLDWEFWCGPAPKLPYSPGIGHLAWRLEKAYGNGHLVDWGIHWIDAVRLILNEDMPHKVNSSGGIYHLQDKITTPDTLTTCFEFETCPVVWRHRLWGAREYPGEPANGMFFYGTEGTLFVNDRKWEIVPNEKNAETKEHKVRTDSAAEHMADFLDAVKTRRQPSCTPADAFMSTATVQLGMISWEVDQRVIWDQKKQTMVNNPQAAQKLMREYRKPWVHPKV